MAKKTEAVSDGTTALIPLSPEQRAEQALSFANTKAQLDVLAKASVTIVRVDTDDSLAAAKAAKAKLQSTRVSIEKTGKEARDGAVKFQKAVIAKERELILVIAPEEMRLQGLISAEERKREDAERVAREEAQARAEAINREFARVRSLPDLAANIPVADIDMLILEATSLLNDQSHLPADMRDAARYEAQVSINGCKAARDRRVQADKDAAELAEFRRLAVEREAAQLKPEPGEVELEPAPVEPEQTSASLEVRSAGPRRADYRASVLLDAARAALRLLVANDLGDRIEAQDLAEAIDDFDLPGGA